MRKLSTVLLLFVFTAVGQSADVATAEANLRRVQMLVEAGAAPRSALQAAQEQLEDARNEQVLQETLYRGDVAPQEIPRMLQAAAALRRLAQKVLAEQQKLVKEGVLAPKALERARQEEAQAEKQWDLAEARAKLTQELAEMARRESEMAKQAKADLALAAKFEGKGTVTSADLARLESAFYQKFSHPLPVSAWGETAVHRSLGFDHRDRVDVALNPDQPEGRWLMRLLDRLSVPYIAFRHAVLGSATGAHIHIGLPSPRL